MINRASGAFGGYEERGIDFKRVCFCTEIALESYLAVSIGSKVALSPLCVLDEVNAACLQKKLSLSDTLSSQVLNGEAIKSLGRSGAKNRQNANPLR
jgi:hypothetical protein